MSVKININENGIKATIDNAWKTGLEMLSSQILRDCNEFCKMDIFDQDPTRLKKMIARESKNARQRFERFDLDGNIEERKLSKKQRIFQ